MSSPSVLDLPSMPMASPSYPRGPYRFINREYLIVTYESDADAIRAALPAALEPDGSGHVLYEFIRMPDSAGFGDYTESGVVIPALFEASRSTSRRRCTWTTSHRSPVAARSGGFPRSTASRGWRWHTTPADQ